MPRIIAGLCMLSLGCGTSSVSSVVGTPRAPRAENGDLLLVSLGDVSAGGRYVDDHEVVGSIVVMASPGATPTDPDVRKDARARACALGGELIVPTESHAQQTRAGSAASQWLSFGVWGRKSKTAPQNY